MNVKYLQKPTVCGYDIRPECCTVCVNPKSCGITQLATMVVHKTWAQETSLMSTLVTVRNILQVCLVSREEEAGVRKLLSMLIRL